MKDLNNDTYIESDIIYNEYINVRNAKSNGLWLYQVPTGSGKTEAMIQFCAKTIDENFMAKQEPENHKDYKEEKIVIIIPTKNNLDKQRIRNVVEHMHRKGIIRESTNNIINKFLWIRSYLDALEISLKKNPDIDSRIEELKLKPDDEYNCREYFNTIRKYINLKTDKGAENLSDLNLRKSWQDELEKHKEDAREAERKLRGILRSLFQKIENEEKQQIKLREKREQWVKTLYEHVDYDNYDVYILTMDKFCTSCDPIIGASANFFQNLIHDRIVFIDEFDATYRIMLNRNIEAGQSNFYDIQLLVMGFLRGFSVYSSINDLPKNVRDAMSESMYTSLIDNLNQLTEKYFALYPYKSELPYKEAVLPAIINSGIPIYNTNKADDLIGIIENKNNRVQIVNQELNENKADTISVEKFAIKVNKFANECNYVFSYKFLPKYMKAVEIDNSSDGLKSILDTIFEEEVIKVMANKYVISKWKPSINIKFKGEHDFYNYGLNMIYLSNTKDKREKTSINMIQVRTPENQLLYMLQNARVIGISATALNSSATDNFDINHLKKLAKGTFHTLSDTATKKFNDIYNKRETFYNDKLNIECDILNKDYSKILKEFMHDDEHYFNIKDILKDLEDEKYILNRYWNLAYVFYKFYSNDKLHSLLVLEQPAANNKEEFNETYIRNILLCIKNYFSINSCTEKDTLNDIVFITSQNYNSGTENIKNLWSSNKKAILVTTYATAGKGVNLDYSIPKGMRKNLINTAPELSNILPSRFKTKDIDAIYLGQITHIKSSFDVKEKNPEKRIKNFINVNYEITKLQRTGNFTIKEANLYRNSIKSTFDTSNEFNMKKQLEVHSYHASFTRTVIQALGRFDRSFMKNKDIVIFLTEDNMHMIDIKEMEKAPMSPIQKYLYNVCKNYNKGKTFYNDNSLELLHDDNEWKDSVSQETIKNLIAKVNNDKKAKENYSALREFLLTNPTASTHEFNNFIHEYFAELNTPDKALYYVKHEKGIFICDKYKASARCISEEFTNLSLAKENPLIKNHMIKHNYALSWKTGNYIMLRAAFDVYKGKLGEVMAEVIINNIIDNLSNIYDKKIARLAELDMGVFEKFDYVLSLPQGMIFIDVKNYYIQVRDKIESDLIQKAKDSLQKCKAHYKCEHAKAMIINISPKEEINNANLYRDEDIIEIKRLLSSKASLDSIAENIIIEAIKSML